MLYVIRNSVTTWDMTDGSQPDAVCGAAERNKTASPNTQT
jgi:hypothetical protein